MAEQTIYIDRPPRIQPELPEITEVTIPNPPDKKDQGFARIVQVSLPLLIIVGYIMVGTMGGVRRNPWFILPMAMSIIGSVIFSIYSYRKEKEEAHQIRTAYEKDVLTRYKQDLTDRHNLQRRFYRENYPSSQVVFQIVKGADHETDR